MFWDLCTETHAPLLQLNTPFPPPSHTIPISVNAPLPPPEGGLRAEASTIITEVTSALPHSLGKTSNTSLCTVGARPLWALSCTAAHTPWQGQSDRHASKDKLPTSSAISADQKLLHRKSQEKPEAVWEALKPLPPASSHHSPRPLCHQPIPPNSPLIQSSHFFWKARSSLGSKMFSSGSQLLCLEKHRAGLVSSIKVDCRGQLPGTAPAAAGS